MRYILSLALLHSFILSAQEFQYNFKIQSVNTPFHIEEATEKLSGHFSANPVFNSETNQFEFQTKEDISFEVLFVKFKHQGYEISDFNRIVLSANPQNVTYEK